MMRDRSKKTHLTEHAFPHISKALLLELEERFPARCPSMDWKDREVWYRAGQNSVVLFLRGFFNEQVERSKQ
jgi:hypothetical protein